jgi:hypothetical protein
MSVKTHREQGMALVTALLVLVLVSSMIVGLAWMVMTDQRLGNNNSDRQRAFYAAEAGMESMAAALAAQFNASPVVSKADVNTIMATTVPADMTGSGIQYISHSTNALCGANGYCMTFTPDAFGNPAATTHTILTGQNAGLVGLLTPYTLQVTAVTPQGSEVKLQRIVQTAAIPIFQFGMFCQTDCDFFAGPDFNFGGRLHSNGNIWLAEGGTLTLSDKVTAAGEIIRSNLENGYPTATNYAGTVNITTNPGSGTYAALGLNQGSINGPNTYGGPYGSLNEPTFGNLASSTYNKNIGVKETGIVPLNVGIATPSIGGQSIDLIRPPVPGELVSNPGKLEERYYGLPATSLRILLSDYGASGDCTTSDILALPLISAGNPVDLKTLATAPPAGTYPLPTSDAQSGAGYTPNPSPTVPMPYPNVSDGYWATAGSPLVTGCIKIDYQVKAGGAYTDVTNEILKLGFTGRNLNPGWYTNSMNGAVHKNALGLLPPFRPYLPTSQVAASPCNDPSGNAVIRLARVRDNPSTGTAVNPCANGLITVANPGTDFWPNVLYDTREAILRDNALPANFLSPTGQEPLGGAMYYVELDLTNLARWFTGVIGASGTNAINTSGYTVYFSDRRGNRLDPNSPPSVGPAPAKTGGYGYDDLVNPADTNGCPNNALDAGEDLEGDFNSGWDTTPVLRTYGTAFSGASAPAGVNSLAPLNVSILLPKVLPLPVTPAEPLLAATTNVTATTVFALNPYPNCNTKTSLWPGAVPQDPRDMRENFPLFFRRALKLVNGGSINLGVCDTVNCGLTIASENPVYVQGDFNALPNGNFGGTHIAASILADAVTLLSNNFNDVNTFAFPYTLGSRLAVTTTYRVAVMGGKGIPFAQPAGTGNDFGTDGGAHNFLRYIENWGGQTLWYRGSIVSLFYSHQAIGTFKCCNTVYSPPTRGYNFDTEFLTPSLLPPQTPMLRSLNTISMTQMDLSTQ